jgi:hypothetical protein
LLATSTTNEPASSPSRDAAPSTNRRACSTHDVEKEEKYAYSVNVSSGVINGGSCASRQLSHTRTCSG